MLWRGVSGAASAGTCTADGTEGSKDVKHTYLYPLEDEEGWLWRVARTSGSDLFGDPDVEAPDGEWLMSVRISEALEEARSELHERLRSRDRICIGRHYVIPDSLHRGARERAKQADGVVSVITRELWEAPVLNGLVYANVVSRLKGTTGRDGQDDWNTISAFLSRYRGRRVVPVWM